MEVLADREIEVLPAGGRRVTRAEADVVRDVLADPRVPRTARIRETHLPPRTYMEVLHRIYQREWVRDRFLPDPGLTGTPYASFLLVQPALGRSGALVESFRRNARIVVCWSMRRTLLAVALSESPPDPGAIRERLVRRGWCTSVESVSADLREGQVPVYFDFEGEWDRYGGLRGIKGYPHGLGRDRSAPEGEERREPTRRIRRQAERMVQRLPPEPPSEANRPGAVGGWGDRYTEQSLIRGGWVQARCFLDPSVVATTLADFADGITWVVGQPRSGFRAAQLAETLVEESAVHPFLLAADAGSVLLGFLSSGPTTRLAPAPSARIPVRQTLEGALERLIAFPEPLASTHTVVDHRYDRLLAPSAPM